MLNNGNNNINHLIQEISPYLQLHASNPVWWYPWGKEAFEKANIENKPIIVSIGYSSCHWCHVMNRETFSDKDVAEIMNQNFISIKVDREERPDVDKIYMEALNLMQIQGGWPLNCFLLPDGRPFWGGTYFSSNDWKDLLVSIKQMFDNQYQKVESHARHLTKLLKVSYYKEGIGDFKKNDTSLLHNIFSDIRLKLDFRDGGFAHSPKFPLPLNILFLLRYGYLFGVEEAVGHALLTLEKMAMGGIYDQLGGGFSRYSTDIRWKIPHFEKMLYDNALLVSIYSDAYRLTKNKFFKQIIFQTLDFIQRDMMADDFSFFSAIDADSETEEGKYYVWTRGEINEILGNDAGIFSRFYGVGGAGYWENNNNILLMQESVQEFADKHYLDYNDFNKILINCRKKLLKARLKRNYPFVDKKTITSWNALMLKAFAEAYLASNNKEYLNIAENNADFIIKKLTTSDGGLNHIYFNGKSSIKGFLDDYAYVIDAFIALYQITFNEYYIIYAKQLMQYVIKNFKIDEQSLFLYSSEEGPFIIVNKSENFDNVLPSANSSLANSLLLLSVIFENKEWENLSYNMLKNVIHHLVSNPFFYANWGVLLCNTIAPNFLITITGKDSVNKAFSMNKYYYPLKIVLASETKSEINCLKEGMFNNDAIISICDKNKCFSQVKSVNEAIKQIKKIVEVQFNNN